ncbi:MAG TPA: NlpC/P60 family protein [Thermomicrobiales bacterium]|nr:NlpC/P60 family protein [Thermomicrobiales bacterium]
MPGGAASVQAQEPAHSLTRSTTPWISLIARVSNEAGVPADVLRALVAVQSDGNAAVAIGQFGETGLAQITPEMAGVVQIGGDLYRPDVNLTAAARYLSAARARWGTWDLAVASYVGMIDDTGRAPAARHDRASSAFGILARYQQALHQQLYAETTPLTAATALAYGLEAVGMPYLAGGDDMADGGFDCSGLVYWSYRMAGVELPHGSGPQWDATQRIDQAQLQPGDLVFFAGTWGSGISHSGIYAGNGYFLHSVDWGEPVQLTPLSDSYWGGHLAGFGRVS